MKPPRAIAKNIPFSSPKTDLKPATGKGTQFFRSSLIFQDINTNNEKIAAKFNPINPQILKMLVSDKYTFSSPKTDLKTTPRKGFIFHITIKNTKALKVTRYQTGLWNLYHPLNP